VLGIIGKEMAEKIKRITGIDVSGFKVAIEARQIYHFYKDHGENGKSDHSMNEQSIAKIEYTLNNPDDIRNGGKTRAYVYHKNGEMHQAETVLYEKGIGEKSYYVVQAIADTKKKTLYIVTAFIGKSGYKKETLQSADARSLGATSKNEAAIVSKTSISKSEEKSNGKFSERDDLGAQIAAVADEIKARKAAGEDTTAWEEWMENCSGAALFQRYTWWYAAWCADEITDYPMHQFGGGTNMVRSNTVAGRVCDQDYCYVDFPAIIRAAGRNGYTADTPTKRRRRHPQRPPRRLKRWRRKLRRGVGKRCRAPAAA